MGITSQNISSNVFTGAINTDLDPRLVKSTDFIAALNIRNGYGVDNGAITNVKGNELINFYTLPTGTNKCLGRLEDALENTLIYFIWNSNGNHRILRLYPSENRTDVLASGSALNFDQNHLIHSSRLVDRTYLFWTDAYETPTGLVGNEPRQLNIVKSSLYNKGYEYEIHLALDDQFTYSTLNGTSITFTVTGGTTTVTFSGITNRQSALDFIISALRAGGYSVRNFNSTTLIRDTGIQQSITLAGTGIANYIRIIPFNFYGLGDISVKHINWAKPQPIYAPVLSYTSKAQGVINRLFGQYAIRYIFDDNSKSAWSAFSIVPFNSILTGYEVLIDFFDPKLNDIGWLSIIKKVEIGVKFGKSNV